MQDVNDGGLSKFTRDGIQPVGAGDTVGDN